MMSDKLIDFIGNKVCRFVYPQITPIFADFLLKIFQSAKSVDYFR
jgi:hypothetical protein